MALLFRVRECVSEDGACRAGRHGGKEATVGQQDEAGGGLEGRKVGGRAQNTRA